MNETLAVAYLLILVALLSGAAFPILDKFSKRARPKVLSPASSLKIGDGSKYYELGGLYLEKKSL